MLDPNLLNSLSEEERFTLLSSLLGQLTADKKVALFTDLSVDPVLALKDLDKSTKARRAYEEVYRLCASFTTESVTPFFEKLALISAFVDKHLSVDDLKNHDIEFVDPCFLLLPVKGQIQTLLQVAKDGLPIYKAMIRQAKNKPTRSSINKNIDPAEYESSILDSTADDVLSSVLGLGLTDFTDDDFDDLE